jgi:hypothetical protein
MDVTVKGVLNNTPDEVAEWLGKAREICLREYDDAQAPDAVLVKVLELLASKTILTMGPQPMPVNLGALGLGGPPKGRH